ncbi:hypothetical protein F4781DRAFT_432763 [Annulohypoxylon bovei var. microspora]|nr:hypothetical protein F4781DRAFT_432763 [Annulohypoxylon bovei var. microspora]
MTYPEHSVGFVPFARVKKLPPVQKISDSALRVVSDWNDYFGPGDLLAWQHFMADLGISGTFNSKTQCRKASNPYITALRDVWVNIVDFLDDVKEGRHPRLFDSQHSLRRYTQKQKKIYPKSLVPKGSPLRCLFARIGPYCK